MKHSLWLIFGLSSLLAGCSVFSSSEQINADEVENTEKIEKVGKNNDAMPETATPKSSIQSPLAGTYYARIKHSECGSLRVNIVIEANQAYEKVIECMRSDAEPFYETGQWQQTDEAIVLQAVQPVETTPEINRFTFKENKLQLSVPTGKTILFKKL